MPRRVEPRAGFVSESTTGPRRLSSRVVEIHEEERKRIAQEFHDRLGKNLAALGIDLSVISSWLPEDAPVAVRGRLANALNVLAQTGHVVRSVVTELRPPVLDDYGLDAALRWYAQEFSVRTRVVATVKSESPGTRLPASLETPLFRVAQEALANVARHASAQRVALTLAVEADSVRLTIADDGVGFAAPDLDAPERARCSWGHSIMRERMLAIGGRVLVKSQAGMGTQVVAEIPR